jgi:hypothetical protein
MIKTRTFELEGRDAGKTVQLTELPALVADRLARRIIQRFDGDATGGIVSLALRYQRELAALGEEGLRLLFGFVHATHTDGSTFDIRRDLRDWRNVAKLQQVALLLHVDFLFKRELLETPVTMRAEAILAGVSDIAVTFCSPFLAAVLQSGQASYVELETVLSTEDAFNLVELTNVEAIREWKANTKPKGIA